MKSKKGIEKVNKRVGILKKIKNGQTWVNKEKRELNEIINEKKDTK